MPTANPIGIQNSVDVRLGLILPDVVGKQDAFKLANGRYWQGLVTSTFPVDGGNVTPNLNSRPYYESQTWAQMFPTTFQAQEPAAFAIHNYKGPLGVGYVIYAWITVTGVDYYKADNHGPEIWRSFAWTPVPVNV